MPGDDAYRGWYRPHKGAPWEAVCSADTYGRCYGLLLDYRREGETHGDKLVLARGDDPNRRRRNW